MALADTKKVQTLINVAASAMEAARIAASDLEDTRDLYISASVSAAGTPLEGLVAPLNTALNSLLVETSGSIWDTLISLEVPTHRGKAL